MIAKERLWLNKDNTKVVRQNSPEAAILLAHTGQDIPKQYEGLVMQMYEAGHKPTYKEVPQMKNKELRKPENKNVPLSQPDKKLHVNMDSKKSKTISFGSGK